MKTLFFFFLILLFSFSPGELISKQDPGIPDDQWQVYSEAGVWSTLALIPKEKSHEHYDKITLYIKNVSTIKKLFLYGAMQFFSFTKMKIRPNIFLGNHPDLFLPALI